jgi:hypothetical protein
MAKVIVAHRNGLEYPMIRCPLTNMGIYVEKKEWNGDMDHPTFSKEITMYRDKVTFRIEDGVCKYAVGSDCCAAGMDIVLKDWDDPVTKTESGYYKSNRDRYRIGK